MRKRPIDVIAFATIHSPDGCCPAPEGYESARFEQSEDVILEWKEVSLGKAICFYHDFDEEALDTCLPALDKAGVITFHIFCPRRKQ